MDVFERVVNGTLHREIKYQFARGHFHVGWRSKTSGNAVTIKGLSTIQKKIHEKWSQEQRDYFFKHYFLIFSFETVQKSLQFGFQTQDYWAVVEDLPPQQRKTFEKKLKQKLSECRREIKKWFPKKSENGKHSQPQNPPKAQNQQNQQNRSKPKPKPKPQRPPSPRNANAVSEQKEVELVDEEKVSEQKEMDQRTERRLPNGSNGRNGSRNKVNERIHRKPQQKSSREQRQNGNNHNANKSKRKRTVSASSGSSSLSLSTERYQPIQPTQPTETRPLIRTKPSMNDILLKYHEIEELQCQTAVLYTNIIEMLTCNQSADDAVGEDNLNLFMSAIGTANSMYQKHKEAVSLYFEHAQIAEEQQEALQRGNMQKQQEIDSLNKMMERQKQEIKALNRSVKRKEEQISKMKKERNERNRKSQQSQEMKDNPQIQQIEASEQDQDHQEVQDIQETQHETQALAPLAPPAPLGPSQWLKEQDSKESKSPPEVNPYMALNPKANEFQPMGMGTYSSVPMQTQSDHEVYGNDQEEVDEEYDDDLKREELYDDGVYDDEVYDDEVYDDEQVIEDLIIKKNNKMYDYTNGNERNEMKMESADHHFDDGMFRD